MQVDRETVLAHLRAVDVARHLGIVGTWRGRWLRSRRCATADHSSDAFGLSEDGYWHCWACDRGGDLLALVASSEGLDLHSDFPRVLEIAAGIAGVEASDTFGASAKPAPRIRPPIEPTPPIGQRISAAKRRAAWVWQRLTRREDAPQSTGDAYLRERGLDVARARAREELRETPLRCTPEEAAKSDELRRLAASYGVPAIALPVRAASDGRLVDVRVRRYRPAEGQPKIIGMSGGVTVAPAEAGAPRRLVGCYGHPEMIDSDLAVITEGAFDYLTALQVWPDAAVLGATEAGSLSLVTAHAARELAQRDSTSRLLIVEQRDPPRTLRDGRVVAGAADASVNEDPNAATKVAMRILGPRRVGWLLCAVGPEDRIKDLNDLLIACNASPARVIDRVRWETEIG
jgi:hypothetical protein